MTIYAYAIKNHKCRKNDNVPDMGKFLFYNVVNRVS